MVTCQRPVDLRFLVVVVQLGEVDHLVTPVIASLSINLKHYLLGIPHNFCYFYPPIVLVSSHPDRSFYRKARYITSQNRQRYTRAPTLMADVVEAFFGLHLQPEHALVFGEPLLQ